VLTLLLAVLAVTLIPAAASAASITVSVSADPTEDMPVTVTASGTADSATRLFVFVTTAYSSCPASMSSFGYSEELSGSVFGSYDGDALAAGSFSRQYEYVPPSRATYRVCAYLAPSAFGVVQASGGTAFTPRLTHATVAIAESADPAEEAPILYTVSGSSELDRRLFVFATRSYSSCPASMSVFAYSEELSGVSYGSYDGDAVGAGAFERTYSYTPEDSGTVLVCAYVAEGAYSETSARTSRTTSVREPHASLAVQESADPTEEKPVTYTVTGSTERDRRLYVFATRSYSSCPASMSVFGYSEEISGVSYGSYDGDAVPAGEFQRTYAYTPADGGSVLVCAYVSEGAYDSPNAAASKTTSVRRMTASVNVALGGDVGIGRPISVVASGMTEGARRVYVFATGTYSSCPASMSVFGYSEELSGSAFGAYDGDALDAGAFMRSYSYTPSHYGRYLFCAYVAEGAYDAPNAAGSASVELLDPSVSPPPRRLLQWQLGLEVPPAVRQGERVPIAVKGQAAGEAELFTYVSPSSTRCQKRAEAHADEAGVKAVTSAQQVAEGDLATSASFGPAAAGTYRVCSYLAFSSDGVPYKTATATFTILPDPALVPVLVSGSDQEHRDRLVLVWKRGANDENDAISVYLSDPADGADVYWEGLVDGGDARISRSGPNYRAVLPHIGYRRFWWTITRPGPYRSNTVSETRTARVVPRPLDRASARVDARLRLGRSSKRPGSAELVIRSSPRAKVTAIVRHAGRVARRWAFTGDFAARKTLRLTLSCRARGPYRLEVTMADPYGARVTRRASWSITDRCGRLQAAERRRAEARRRAQERRREAERRRREAERRRQEAQAPPAPSGGGEDGYDPGPVGCDGDPGATPYPQFDGQRDGDGDGCYGET